MTAVDTPPAERRDATSHAVSSAQRSRRIDIIGVAAVVVIMLLGYFEVPFLGKTFDTSTRLWGGVIGCPEQIFPGVECDTIRGTDPRIDQGASAWQFRPWSELTNRQIGEGTIPLWNPTAAAGAPLAANMQSAALDPLFLPVLVHPSPLVWDVTILGTLILGALATYALAGCSVCVWSALSSVRRSSGSRATSSSIRTTLSFGGTCTSR